MSSLSTAKGTALEANDPPWTADSCQDLSRRRRIHCRGYQIGDSSGTASGTAPGTAPGTAIYLRGLQVVLLDKNL